MQLPEEKEKKERQGFQEKSLRLSLKTSVLNIRAVIS